MSALFLAYDGDYREVLTRSDGLTLIYYYRGGNKVLVGNRLSDETFFPWKNPLADENGSQYHGMYIHYTRDIPPAEWDIAQQWDDTKITIASGFKELQRQTTVKGIPCVDLGSSRTTFSFSPEYDWVLVRNDRGVIHRDFERIDDVYLPLESRRKTKPSR
ncbi:MAG: hypothetical protein H6751_05420 [Candidatus Omnitrophica bacterium]|nr:hypothetical protein [Candidatus Omnitrophota bacterium]